MIGHPDMASSRGGVARLLCLAMAAAAASAAQFRVGEQRGWSVPDGGAEPYNSWAGRMRFVIGDQLLFVYPKGSDSVLVVDAGAYGSCNTTAYTAKFEDGNTVVTLDRSGPFYFISGNEAGCKANQKLEVVVLAAAHTPPPAPVSPSPSSMPPSPASPPSSMTPPMASPPSPGPSSAAPMPAPAAGPGASAPAPSPTGAAAPADSPPAPGSPSSSSSPDGPGGPASPPGGSQGAGSTPGSGAASVTVGILGALAAGVGYAMLAV